MPGGLPCRKEPARRWRVGPPEDVRECSLCAYKNSTSRLYFNADCIYAIGIEGTFTKRPMPKPHANLSDNLRTVASEELAYLKRFDASAFGRVSVAVDLVLLTVEEDRMRVLILRRADHPAKGKWALPGGFVGIRESLEGAARRVLAQTVALPDIFVEQLFTFGEVERDPRMRVVSVAHFALVEPATLQRALAASTPEPLALADVSVAWPGEEGGPVAVRDARGVTLPLAFDHAEILGVAVKRLRGRLRYSPIAFELLPREFTLRALQRVHEAILARRLNKDAFRRRVLASKGVIATGRLETSVGHRPAELYRWAAAIDANGPQASPPPGEAAPEPKPVDDPPTSRGQVDRTP